MSQNLLSAAVMIGALRVKSRHFQDKKYWQDKGQPLYTACENSEGGVRLIVRTATIVSIAITQTKPINI